MLEKIEYIVTNITGEYAHLENIETGDDMLVAMALLPEETDIGIHLLWEDLSYSVS